MRVKIWKLSLANLDLCQVCNAGCLVIQDSNYSQANPLPKQNQKMPPFTRRKPARKQSSRLQSPLSYSGLEKSYLPATPCFSKMRFISSGAVKGNIFQTELSL